MLKFWREGGTRPALCVIGLAPMLLVEPLVQIRVDVVIEVEELVQLGQPFLLGHEGISHLEFLVEE